MFDIAQVIGVAPNLAFGFACLYLLYQIHKERLAESARYATSLEKINELYIQLLERAVTAIANNATQSTHNGESLVKLLGEFAAIRQEFGGLRDRLDRFIRDSAKRNQPDHRGTQSGPGTD